MSTKIEEQKQNIRQKLANFDLPDMKIQAC